MIDKKDLQIGETYYGVGGSRVCIAIWDGKHFNGFKHRDGSTAGLFETGMGELAYSAVARAIHADTFTPYEKIEPLGPLLLRRTNTLLRRAFDKDTVNDDQALYERDLTAYIRELDRYARGKP